MEINIKMRMLRFNDNCAINKHVNVILYKIWPKLRTRTGSERLN